jgi:hypothetical protein
MAVQSEASGLRSNRELGDEAKDFVITDFVLVVYLIPLQPFFLDSLKFKISPSYRFKVPYLKCLMPPLYYLPSNKMAVIGEMRVLTNCR